MKLCLRIALLFLVTGTLTQDLDLWDALDTPDPTPQKPKEKPKTPEQPKKDGDLDLLDAFGPGDSQPEKPKKPSPGGSDSNGFDLGDAVNPGKTWIIPISRSSFVSASNDHFSGGGSFDDSDLFDVSGGDYKPDGGRSGGTMTVILCYFIVIALFTSLLWLQCNPKSQVSNSRPRSRVLTGGAGQPQGSGPIAGIISAVGVALVGAASSYFAYQKKKLCFKLQGGADPESGKGHQGTRSEPQVLSNLLQTN
ncbi:CD99 molecule [Neolamprologus brichardi]|uniref:CD99 molecule n=1 Tax=Neolamprologus brichardi TaxID=32507 RepID=UPI0016437731|nr:CD99 molecule [Neolamprologus brichardi]